MKCVAKLATLLSATQLAQASYLQTAGESVAESNANPIRKVVTMLQAMQKKVEAEAEKEKELFEKYMCYCKTSSGSLETSIASSDAKIPEVEAAINEAEAKKVQLDEDLKQHQADRVAAKKAVADATALREKEAAAFAEEKASADSDIQAIVKATSALEKGVFGGFLQTSASDTLKKIALQSSGDGFDVDRRTLLAFLQNGQGSDYVPQSGEIIGILKELGGEMGKSLSDATKAEDEAIATYESLTGAKKKEIEALTQSIEDKTVRAGETAVAIVQMKDDLSDTEASFLEDKKFLKDMEENCGNKDAEWAEISKTRAEESVALAETIKILQDDDALELFKKTLPSASASFVQMRASAAKLSSRALEILHAARAKADKPVRQQFDFIALALHGKRVGGFEKVIKMIDDMIALLKTEQGDDDKKKTYCSTELDTADDKKKSLERKVADAETAMSEAEDAIATLSSEIKALEDGIAALDKSVAEATAQRKAEHEDFLELMSSDNAAKDLLAFAKNRLNQFYNPKLYVAPPTTAAPAFVQISAHAANVDAPAPPPETFKAYSAKSEESTGVIAMIDMLVKDLDKEITEAETSEKNAQEEYEQMTADAADKRATDSSSVTEKTSAKADTEAALQSHKDDHESDTKELMATVKTIQALHGECDWLMQYFDVRSEARASEIDSLANAKAVLSGADYSMLVQTDVHDVARRSSGFLSA